MAKKIELLHTTYDESGNIESQEVVHPLTSPDCIIMENGKTLDEVMGDGIATPTLTHEGTSFKVGVGDSNIEVVDGDVAGMTLKGQSYQNILPKPTTLIMETDEKEFKINDKIDSNIIIDDNIAEIATIKGKTIVNAVQEESASVYTVLGEDLSGQSIIHVKETPTLEGQTLVNHVPKFEKIMPIGTGSHRTVYSGIPSKPLKPNTSYLFINHSNVGYKLNVSIKGETTSEKLAISNLITSMHKFTTPDNTEDFTRIMVYLMSDNESELTYNTFMIIEYQEGMENWDIPYFEGEKYFESNIKGVTLQGQTLVNTIQEPCKHDYVVLGADDGIEISAETGGCGTIEDTIGGSIKSAILKGNTLVNLRTKKRLLNNWVIDVGNSYTKLITQSNGYVTGGDVFNAQDISKFKPSTKYLLVVEIIENTSTNTRLNFNTDFQNESIFLTDTPAVVENGKTGIFKWVLTTKSDFTLQGDSTSHYVPRTQLTPYHEANSTFTFRHMVLEYQDGMENWDIPYFEGMQSVKMPVLTTTGKNMFDINGEKKVNGTGFSWEIKGNKLIVSGNGVNGTVHKWNNIGILIDGLIVGDWYTLSYEAISDTENAYSLVSIHYPDGSSYGNVNGLGNKEISFSPSQSSIIVRFFATNESNANFNQTVTFSNFQLEQGSKATSYEPFKSNILTTSEEVELRGIGDVKDELNLLTGELTQRIGEIDFNTLQLLGWHERETTVRFIYTYYFNKMNQVICNNYPLKPNDEWETDTIGIENGYNDLSIAINKSELSEISRASALNFINNKGIRVWGILRTPNVKTVVLTVTDQDNNTIPHIQTQPTVTHITASSDYLIPTVTIDNNLAYDTIIKPSTLYTIRFKHDTVNADNPLTVDLGGTTQTVTSTEFTITTPNTLAHNQLVFSGKNNVVSEVQVIEGDVTNIEYPFFEGMSDVKFSDGKFIARNCPFIFGKGGRI